MMKKARRVYALPNLILLLSIIVSACTPALPTPEVLETIPNIPVATSIESEATEISPVAEPEATEISPVAEPEATIDPEPVETEPMGELVVLIGSDIEDTLPLVSSGRYLFMYVKNVYGYLYRRSGEMTNIPDLATDYSVSDDGRVYTFTLREGVYFHNGDPFSAKDVEFTFNFVTNPEVGSPEASWFSMVDRVEAIDDLHVAFYLNRLDATFMSKLSAFFPILPADYFESVGLEDFRKNPAGTGPFRFVSREIGDILTIEAFEDYWGVKPEIKTIIFKVVPEISTRVAMMKTGEADILVELPAYLVPNFEADSNLNILSSPGGDQARIWIDIVRACSGKFPEMDPICDPIVRQAMNYAVDRSSMAGALLGGNAFIAPSVMPASVIPSPPELEPYPYDPEKARQLLAEAGYPNGFEFEMVTSIGRYPLDKEISEAVAGYLAQVGIRVKLTPLEGGAWSDRLRDYENTPFVSYHPWSHNVGHPDGMLNATFACNGAFPFYCEPEVDEAIVEGVTILDQDEMIKHYQELDRKFYDEAVWIFLWENPRIHVVSDRVNWEPVVAEPWEKFWDASLNE